MGAGQLEAAELLVTRGADLHQAHHTGSSLMEVAAYSGHSASVRWLGSKGFEVGLLELCAIGDLDAVMSVLASDPNWMKQRDRRGLTALHHAARCGHVEVIEQLINRGADLEAANRHGHVPLSVAVEANQLDAVKRLLRSLPRYGPAPRGIASKFADRGCAHRCWCRSQSARRGRKNATPRCHRCR